MDCMTSRVATRNRQGPPESIDETPIDVEEASRLMATLGFVLFRTPPGARLPASCLMLQLNDEPTGRHFDPEVVDYWAIVAGHGRSLSLDGSVHVPFSGSYSWGQIRITDRYGVRNRFVSFGGELSGESVGPGAKLIIFRSPATILRLPGHSQRQDRMAEEALTFFAHVIPRLWEPGIEPTVSDASPLDLYASFLLDTRARIERSSVLRVALERESPTLQREIAALERAGGGHLEAGRALLSTLGLPSNDA